MVPVYNETDNLEQCLNSLLSQQYTAFEIVLVDDGSQEPSLAVSRAYAERDKRIRLIECVNQGVSHARNTGIAASRGELITFVDSDDVVSDDYLGHLVDVMESTKADCATCTRTYLSENDAPQPTGSNPVVVDTQTAAIGFATSYGWFCTGKMYKASLLTENHVRFPEQLTVCEDMIFNLDVLDRCHTVAYLENIDYFYRQTAGSLTNDLRNPRWFDSLDAYQMILSRQKSRKLANALEYNCRLVLSEARYRTHHLDGSSRAAMRKKLHATHQLLHHYNPLAYSVKDNMKMLIVTISPMVFMHIRARRVQQ